MLILSQDKNRIINFNNVNQIFIVGKEIFADTEKSTNLLGEYKTSARATEVLQEILERYTNWNNLMYGQPEGLCSPK